MAASLEQLVRTPVLLREVNDRVATIVNAENDAPAEFLCECSNDGCAETLPLSLLEYRGIRSSPNLFVILPGHETSEVDRIVEAHARFSLVEKTQRVDLVVSSHRDSPPLEGGQVEVEDERQRGRQNQREFRYANTRLLDVMTGPNASRDGQLLPFLCECADSRCIGSVQITAGRYDAIHLDQRDYVILPGHLRIAGEEILVENEYYEVVQKAA